MPFLMTFIKALPFFIPFLKEVTATDKEGRTHTCSRVVFIFTFLALGFYLIGKPIIDEYVEMKTEIKVLQNNLIETRRTYLEKVDEAKQLRDLLTQEQQRTLHLRNLHDGLLKDHRELEHQHRDLVGDYREVIAKLESYQRGAGDGQRSVELYDRKNEKNKNTQSSTSPEKSK